jgi:L-threonylcarbamoyladenylate synthase
MHDPVGDAVDWVREGGLLAFPTETVWGLGVDSRSEGALRRLQHWKGRDASAPISILIADADCLDPLGFEPSDAAWHLIKNFWPGPLTLVLSCRGSFAPGVSRPDGAVGVRCSSHPVGAMLARRLQVEGVGPVTATSLNRSGAPAARTLADAQAACDSEPESPRLLAIEGAESGSDFESTVIDVTGADPRVLRWGAITESDLAPILDGLRTG